VPEGGTLEAIRTKIQQLPAHHLEENERQTYARARFLFCRDTLSRDYLRAQKVVPRAEFGPDSAFAFHLRDDVRADTYLRAHGLEHRRFICVIPRRRYTPYYQMAGTPASPEDLVRDEISARSLASDHAKMRELMVAWVKNTGGKVLACPEMTYEVELAKKELVDPLPAEVRKHVVWREHYWLPDEAASVYANAQAVISMECHSPILALINGTPAIYLRQPTDTIKGQMYRDIGLGDWLREIDETSGQTLWATVEQISSDPEKARRLVREAMTRVETLQRQMMLAVRASVA
jgi:polysaccharide pyruvyl transferase WcaK-like protein